MAYDIGAKLRLELPVLQAPMAGTATPELAAAVSNAGGLGGLGLAGYTVEEAVILIDETFARTSHAFNVNLFCHRQQSCSATVGRAWIESAIPLLQRSGATPPDELQEGFGSFIGDRGMFAMLLEKKPRVISFHFGLPDQNQLSALRETGALLMATATSLSEAEHIAQAGLDAVIAQGWGAGGHRGIFDPDGPDEKLDTEALTRLLHRNINVPVIAAGGIMDGADVKSALSWGAAAAQMGTAFISCPESAADDLYRASLNEQSTTIMTRAVSGRPARALVNNAIRFLSEIPESEVPPFPYPYELSDALNAAAKKAGDRRFYCQLAGSGVAKSRHVSAAAVMAEISLALGQGKVSNSWRSDSDA